MAIYYSRHNSNYYKQTFRLDLVQKLPQTKCITHIKKSLK
jgi:hypothetical protein